MSTPKMKFSGRLVAPRPHQLGANEGQPAERRLQPDPRGAPSDGQMGADIPAGAPGSGGQELGHRAHTPGSKPAGPRPSPLCLSPHGAVGSSLSCRPR